MIFDKKINIGIKPHHVALTMKWSNTFTKDIASLETKMKHYLFVCDDWMSDRKNSHILTELDGYVLEAKHVFTQQPYRFYNYSGYGQSCPVVLVGLDSSRKIKGELVSFTPRGILQLDRLRLNGIQFHRRPTHLIVPYRDEIVFENTTEERRPDRVYGMVDWRTGKFPDGHPLAGKKQWVSEEKWKIIQADMYFGHWRYWSYPYKSNIAAFSEVPRFQPKQEKKWLKSEYYKYQT
jgi:hypothetical protein